MTEVYVLEHVKHIYDKALGRPVDSHRWHSVHSTFEEATFAGATFAQDSGLLGTDPIYVWWRMHEDARGRTWWLSNEFGPGKKNVGNSLRVKRHTS